MHRAVRRLGLLVLGALVLGGCGEKGPLCLQEPKPATVPATAPAVSADSSAPVPAATPADTTAATATASTTTPYKPVVPGYTRCH
jgi:predicted small lipoprotein YifL